MSKAHFACCVSFVELPLRYLLLVWLHKQGGSLCRFVSVFRAAGDEVLDICTRKQASAVPLKGRPRRTCMLFLYLQLPSPAFQTLNESMFSGWPQGYTICFVFDPSSAFPQKANNVDHLMRFLTYARYTLLQPLPGIARRACSFRHALFWLQLHSDYP